MRLPARTIHGAFEECVRRSPDAIAIEFGDVSLTYRELNERANFCAARLIEAGVRAEDRVAVSLERSEHLPIALLGILKAGAAYVPLSDADPESRRRQLLQQVAPSVHLVDHAFTQGRLAENPKLAVDHSNLCYVLFSSGSTGVPKGIMVEHRSVLRLVTNTGYARFHSSETFLFLAPLAFDASTFEIWGALLNGARLVIMPEGFKSLREIGCEIERRRVTTLWLTSGLFSAMVDQELPRLGGVRQLLTGGDVVSPDHAQRFLKAYPGARLINGYGPTEGTTFTCCYPIPATHPADAAIPIGTPIAGTSVLIVNEQLQPVPDGEKGELLIGGNGLARGYLGQPDLTAEKFLTVGDTRYYRSGDLARRTPEGIIEFHGRLDSQIKLRGFRIELGEVENALASAPGVRQAAVIARAEGSAEKQLIAFVSMDGALNEASLRAHLSERVPTYMVPAAFIARRELPLTANGKIDRHALEHSIPFAKPGTSGAGLEAEVAAIWSEVLGTSVSDFDRPFFDLGGSSLQLMRAHAALERRLARRVETADLFRFPTVRSIARFLAGETEDAAQPEGGKRKGAEVAIVGMAGRFPGASNVREFWSNLKNGVESIRFFDPSELEAGGEAGFVHAKPVLDDAEMFDAAYFGIMPKEAEIIDPQQRVFLECSVEALEDAGCAPGFKGAIGVFAGSTPNTYFLRNFGADPAFMASYTGSFQVGNYPTMLGTSPDFLATRVAYKLNLTGPAISMATACSTSLVAVAQACESLVAGTCDAALAGGVSITFPQNRGYRYQEGGIVSPDGHCRAFDAEAQGTVFGSGCGVVLLKRVEDALAAGDHIYAVIKGWGINNDGAGKAGFTAPGVEGQAAAIRRAHQMAGIDPSTVTYVEAHGTATPLGDPIEVAALKQAFGQTRAKQYCALGTAKTNVGHLDAAAGVTGLIKAALSVEEGCLPPVLHFKQPNPRIGFEDSPFYVVDRLTEWRPEETPRRAGVSSFGVGGTNAHLLIQEAPAQPALEAAQNPQLLVLSGRDENAVDRAASRLAAHLESHPGVHLGAAAWTLQTGRTHHQFRRAVVAANREEAITRLRKGTDAISADDRPLVFTFPGQGAQQPGAGRELYGAFPAFRNAVDECAGLLRPQIGGDIRKLLFDESARLNRTVDVQPAMFVIEYALAELWKHFGLRPRSVLGHSLGEFAAATQAGVFALGDALEAVFLRAKLMQALPGGAMLAVRLSEQELLPLLGEDIDLAAVNAPNACVAAGSFAGIEDLEKRLDERKIAARRLNTSHAFHSRMMEPVVAPLRSRLEKMKLRAPFIPFVSTLTGDWITAAQATNPDYWTRHCCEPVRFSQAVERLRAERSWLLLETGPGQTLISLAAQQDHEPNSLRGIPSFGSREAEPSAVLATLGRLWGEGQPVNWQVLHPRQNRRKASLPAYPFERVQHSLLSKMQPAKSQPAKSTSGVKPSLIALFEELSGMDLHAAPASATFLELGFDSLFLTQVSQKIENRWKVRVRFAELLGELNTFTLLAAHLDQHVPAAPAPEPAPAPAAALPVPTAVSSAAGAVEQLIQQQLRAFNELAAAQLQALRGSAPAPAPAAPTVAPAPKFEAFGPYKPVQKSVSGEIEPRQAAYINSFVDRYASKTVGSKRHTQQYRKVLADPRVASGFRAQWKEIVYPIVAAKSAGSRLWDVDGNEYIDILNGFGVTMFGHAPRFVSEAVAAQIENGYEIGPQTPLAGKVAELICELTGSERATFCNTGSEAVMAAMRLARTVTGRDKVVFFAGDYHGAFDEVLVKRAGARDGVPQSRPIAPGIPREAAANVIVLDYGVEESLEIIRANAREIAAVIVEPVQSRHPNLQPREFLHKLRAITAESGSALVFDEVVTGFRTHPGGAQAIFDVRADLATYGKVIGGGLPLGVLAGKAKFMDALDGGMWNFGDASSPEAGVTFFAGTFVRHPLAMAALWAVLNKIKEAGPALQDDLSRRAGRLTAELNRLFEAECVPTRVENFRSVFYFSFGADQRFGSLLYYHLRYRGIHIQEGFPCFLTTAHTDADIDQIIEAFRGSVHDMQSGGLLPMPERQMSSPIVCPLTEAQMEIRLSAQMGDEESCAFNEGFSIRFRGPLNEAALRASVAKLVDRHEALRATLAESGDQLVIHPRREIPIPMVDLSAHNEPDAEIAALKSRDARTAFDLLRGPLVRMQLVRRGTEDHTLLVTAHHIICDGWSTGVMLEELGRLYSAESSGTATALEPAPRFSEYAFKAESSDSPAVEKYWVSQYAKPAPPLELPLDRPRPAVKTFNGATLIQPLKAEAINAIRQACAKRGSTLFSGLFTTFQLLISRLSRQNDVVIGIPSAGQSSSGNAGLVGHCVNFLPVRVNLEGAATFAELLARSRKQLLDAQEHSSYTYGTLVRKLAIPRNPSRLPLIEVQFNLERVGSALRFGELVAAMEQNPKSFVNFDVFLNLVEHPAGVMAYCDYNTDLFDEATIARWLAQYQNLLLSAATRMDAPLASVSPLSESDLDGILTCRNATATPVPEECAHALFSIQAAANPAKVAVRMGDRSLTYPELDQQSNQLAHWLRKKGAVPGALVGISLEPSIEMLVAVLGVLKSGAAYLPLDPGYPAERLEYIRRDAGAALTLTNSNWPALEGLPLDAPPRVSTSELAYVIYTSGSTGAPKGVEIEHSALTNFLWSMKSQPGIEPADRLLAVTTLSFDIAGLELLLPLLAGAQVEIAPRDATRDGIRLARLMEGAGITMMQATPTTWKMLLDAGWSGNSTLKILTGGEELTRDLASELLARAASVWNMYGPTETTIWSAIWQAAVGSPVSIGRPIANTQLYVLDQAMSPVPDGVAGELYIGGAGLARGYRNRAELTGERFVRNPFGPGRLYRTGDLVRYLPSGELIFMGRLDRQVKLRGHRIELGEIEEALRACDSVSAAAVIVREDRPGEKRLAAYVVGAVNESLLRTQLGARLPSYMVPSQFVELASLPLTANGKTDRLALEKLPAPETLRARSSRPPANEAEGKLAAIVKDVLNLSDIGVDDDLFELGADSIHLFKIAARCAQEGLNITPKQLLQHSTVAGAARTVAAPAKGPGAIAAVSRDSFRIARNR